MLLQYDCTAYNDVIPHSSYNHWFCFICPTTTSDHPPLFRIFLISTLQWVGCHGNHHTITVWSPSLLDPPHTNTPTHNNWWSLSSTWLELNHSVLQESRINHRASSTPHLNWGAAICDHFLPFGQERKTAWWLKEREMEKQGKIRNVEKIQPNPIIRIPEAQVCARVCLYISFNPLRYWESLQ